MDDVIAPTLFEPDERFAVGQPVPRAEDPVLLRGEGHYTDDIGLPRRAYAVMVRSHFAHGIIRGIDIAAARAIPGVLAIYAAADLAEGGIGPLPPRQVMHNRDGTSMLSPARYALATDKVRHVGEAVAAVIADTLALAKDAAEMVAIDIAPLPVVTEPADADRPGAPILYDEVPRNVGCDFHFGDSDKVAAAFAAAVHVTRLRLRNNRIVVNAMEPRAALALYDPVLQRWTLHVGCQGVFGFRNYLAQVLGVGRERLRVLTERVGGSFGMKQPTYAEYYCILHAARELHRPVKWTDERSGSFVSDTHGRDAIMNAELALDADGNFLAVRLSGYGNLGAAYGAPGPPTRNAVRNTLGVYRTPLIEVSTKCVFTNTTTVGAYRGAGRPEANYYMERLVETAAAELGINRVALRRKNHIPPAAMPYRALNGTTYDSDDFTNLLNAALELADWDGFAARRRERPVAGKASRPRHQRLSRTDRPAWARDGRHPLRGERRGDIDHRHPPITGRGIGRLLPSRFDESGWRRATATRSSRAAAPAAGWRSSRPPTNASRPAGRSPPMCWRRRRPISSSMPAASSLPAPTARWGCSSWPKSSTTAWYCRPGCRRASTSPTGIVGVVRYSFVNDFGVVVNPLLVAGQAQGGIVQGIGQALRERTVYDAHGQLLTGSYMDYALPRADEIPVFRSASHPVWARTSPLGVKGCGEAGCAGALASVMNALVDALAEYGIRHIDMPATPERRDARATAQNA